MKQIRGEGLRKKIAEGIRKLAAEAKFANKPYTYNASQLATTIGTSRPTLAKHADIIDKILKDLVAQKRMENGEGVIQLLREKVQGLESEKEELKRQLEVVRNHHAQIYRSLYYNAGTLEPLIRPIVEEEIIEAERCILCGMKIHEIGHQEATQQKRSKVVRLPAQRGPNRT